MKKKIYAFYKGEPTESLKKDNLYGLILDEEYPNTVCNEHYTWKIEYKSVYEFFNDWKLI